MKPKGVKKLPFAGSEAIAELEGPAGQVISLTDTSGTDSDDSYTRFSWATTDRCAHDLELRVSILSCNGVIGTIPILRWFYKLGHGDTNHAQPQQALAATSGAKPLPPFLPQRGMVRRINARNLDLYFALKGVIAGGLPAAGLQAQLAVSVQPTQGDHVPVSPSETYVVAAGATIAHGFPAGATEWRACDAIGQPLTAASVVGVLGLCGALIGGTTGNLMADWVPIPTLANRWTASAGVQMVFR